MLLTGLVLTPGLAHAQRGMSRYRNAQPMTSYGPAFNPALTPEWRQAGGNPDVYQQIVMQKMAAAEQAAFQKQFTEYQKQMKAQGLKPQTTTTTLAPRHIKKKRATLKPSTATTTTATATAGVAAKVEEEEEAEAVVKPATPATSTVKPAAPK